jgi:hypothetical protein
VAAETIRAELILPRIVLGGKKLKAAFLLLGQQGFAAHGAIEFRIERGQRAKKSFQGNADALG